MGNGPTLRTQPIASAQPATMGTFAESPAPRAPGAFGEALEGAGSVAPPAAPSESGAASSVAESHNSDGEVVGSSPSWSLPVEPPQVELSHSDVSTSAAGSGGQIAADSGDLPAPPPNGGGSARNDSAGSNGDAPVGNVTSVVGAAPAVEHKCRAVPV